MRGMASKEFEKKVEIDTFFPLKDQLLINEDGCWRGEEILLYLL